jgi:hypothetical protein
VQITSGVPATPSVFGIHPAGKMARNRMAVAASVRAKVRRAELTIGL